jgi:hypothetical protein
VITKRKSIRKASRKAGVRNLPKPSARKPLKSITAPEDFIRSVPLHYPKPSVSVSELAARGGESEGDVFDGKPRVAPVDAHLSYQGGPLLQNVQVFLIFWGGKWQTAASAAPLVQQIQKFYGDILVSPLLDQLAEYSVPGKAIGHGSLTGSVIITDGAPVGSVTDSAIKAQLKKWIKAKTIPKHKPQTLYFIYLEPGIVSIMGGSKSCQNYCGYHNNTGSIYYAVMPYPSCTGCLGGLTTLDALTGTSSHELCEAITDPIPGKGWYDDKNGEIGDICAWNFKTVSGHKVQMEWSNTSGRCV